MPVSPIGSDLTARERKTATASLRWCFGFFVVSGFCGLVYEVVWLRLAMASFGVTTALASIVISMFMAGRRWGAGFALLLSCGIDYWNFVHRGSAGIQTWTFAVTARGKLWRLAIVALLRAGGHLDCDCAGSLVYVHGSNVSTADGCDSTGCASGIGAVVQLSLYCQRAGRADWHTGLGVCAD